VLIRAGGPALAAFGLAGVLADPRITLYQSDTVAATNDNWTDDAVRTTSARVGAFGFAAGSKDAALVTALTPGLYSMHVDASSATAAASGVAIAEVYDAGSASSSAHLVNISTRAYVGTGDAVLTAGFVISGSTAKTVLIRAIGPTLGIFGVGDVLPDPVLRLYQGDVVLEENDNWPAFPEILAAAKTTGAFDLPAGSKDAVILVTLSPGQYTAQVSGVSGATGAGMVEVYEVTQ